MATDKDILALAESADAQIKTLTARLDQVSAQLNEVTTYTRETRGLVGPFAVPLADGKLLVHTLQSVLLIVDSLDLIMTPQIVIYRQWEPDITGLLYHSLTNDTVFVDVGANIGYFTCLAGTRIRAGGKGRVIAVEPNPECIALLERNLSINWSMCDVQLHKKGAAGARGAAWLSAPVNKAANAHLAYAEGNNESDLTYKVELERLDDMVPKDVIVDIMKIDVEGHEKTVLDGAHDVIARSKDIKIIMEWSIWQMSGAGYSAQTMLDKFNELDLVPRKLPKSNSLLNLTFEDAPMYGPEELANTAYDNILLTRKR